MGSREVDYCSCDGDISKCDFYENMRKEARAEGRSSNTVTQQALKEIEDLIGFYWGTDPAYYTGSENKEEADAAKLCCKILETIWLAQEGENDEKDS